MSGAIFTCSVCFDDKTDRDAVRLDVGPGETNTLCHECVVGHVVPQFEEAIKYEHQYPPKYGQIALEASDFSSYLGSKFTQRYRRREAMYKTPPGDRVFCRNLIVESTKPAPGDGDPGKKLALGTRRAQHLREQLFNRVSVVECGVMLPESKLQKPMVCYSCRGKACSTCGDPCGEGRVGKTHKCIGKPPPIDTYSFDEAAFEGLVRGSDFQLCPVCKTPVALHDGCNFIHCANPACQLGLGRPKGMCYCCGAIVTDKDPHWKVGMPCPRYNAIGATNAVYDGVGAADAAMIRRALRT